MEMKKYKLGEIADVIGGVNFEPTDIEANGIRILRGGNIQNHTISIKEDDVFLPAQYQDVTNQVQVGDTIIVASTGSVEVLGKAATCFDEIPKTQIGAFLRLLRPKEPQFAMLISIAVNSEHFRKYIRAQAKGTSINNINLGHLKSYEFEAPAKLESISTFYYNIETKMALNRAINHNLEAMAKQLYDYWFVQFDFPNKDGRPYKSSGGSMTWNNVIKREIPSDWKVVNIFDAVNVRYGFPFATEKFTEEVTSIPIVRIRDILEGTISAYSLEATDEKYKLQEGDLLVGMDGNFHMNYWHDNTAYLNQRCVRFRMKEDSTISAIQTYYNIQPYIKAKEQNAKGSTVGHLSDKDLKELYVIEPQNTSNFHPRDFFDSLLIQIVKNKQQILELSKQRDELLPLLMSGQVSITQLNYDLSHD